jgi:Uncharacterized protein conserved in bacteria (DUF2188)
MALRMALRYEIVPHLSGWAILVAPTSTGAFATKDAAYEVAVDYARKLQCAGHSVRVHVQHHGKDLWRSPTDLPLLARRQRA